MKARYASFGMAILLLGCGDDSAKDNSDDNRPSAPLDAGSDAALDAAVDSTVPYSELSIDDPTIALRFSVMGDVPYIPAQFPALESNILQHNAESDSEFMVHVGDINGYQRCDALLYERMATRLKVLEVPTFVLVGDNEWNDCANPDEAWDLWFSVFAEFEKNWPDAPEVEHQEGRRENFAWLDRGILLVGITLVGGLVHDQGEWNSFMDDGADWLETQLEAHGDGAEVLVFMVHANPTGDHERFMSRFLLMAESFGRPILFINGDWHSWQHDRPWDPQNILRIQIEGGEEAMSQPIQIGIAPGATMPFVIDREPLSGITPDVDAG